VIVKPPDSPATALSVPLLDLTAQYTPIRDEILAAITRVCDSQRFILGPEVEAMEAEFAAMLGAADAVTVSSGTDALLAVLMALGIGPGDEVITPTFSFFATAGCVSRVGATPVFVDIDPVTFNADPAAIAAALTPRTKAILPVHPSVTAGAILHGRQDSSRKRQAAPSCHGGRRAAIHSFLRLQYLKAWMPGRITGFGPLIDAVVSERFFESLGR